ncbi:hypothetical protein QDW19_gp64 [Microbacterium phage AvGardian]|uniref:hypothetical protein n=1 Tax=Microbacterium phage AvGardian TaxID=2725619 RepID=UPI001463250D|nr:hypothetical protein QDW19_gp64 [Microbacterium phage AvGardian]QJD49879.1 hypothetical protein SEA_AVGARDIAN_64 [Microbacterium phage AvGardian]
MADKAPEAGYTISLFVSRKTPPHTKGTGYEKQEFPGETVELGRVELRGTDLETLLGKTKSHIDLIEES